MTADTTMTLTNLSAAIVAVGALGTAAFGLVDTFKMLPGGGLSRAGFKFVREIILKLAPEVAAFDGTGLSRDAILYALQSQWINGTASSDQVNIAKSLIKLRLTPATSDALAKATGVDAVMLSKVAANIESGTPLTAEQSDVYGRFDLLLTTVLDQAYKRADQRYRNAAKAIAVPVSVGLALAAALVTGGMHPASAALLGLIATPLAPIAKDLATGLTTAMQAIQSWKG
ncbi:MAG TPA: hypothetical protein VEJ46_04520 [Candidatus Acidoferrum sp.]|nr:hypothetical protein [Candidatus Acidoferrum sp.]